MTVPAVEATPGILGSTLAPGTTTGTPDADKEMFLQLLVAQMRYQDPSNPTDSSQFLSQTAQFTALEKMQEVADKTSELVALQVAFGASSMVGKTVTYPGADGETLTGVVTSVRFEATGPVLEVNGEDVFLGELLSVGAGTTDLGGEDTTPPDNDAGDPAAV